MKAAVSYSEISLHSSLTFELTSMIDSFSIKNKIYLSNTSNMNSIRPDCLELQSNADLQTPKSDDASYEKAMNYLKSEGTVMKDGDLILFVAQDLENKIKLSSPVTKKGETPFDSKNSIMYLYRQALTPLLPNLEHNILNELENEARKVATTVDSITENLSAILHSASALTVGCLETYRDSVCKTCDAIDFNIKSMYQLMAKCEELSKCMGIVSNVSEKTKDMKKLLDLFENIIN